MEVNGSLPSCGAKVEKATLSGGSVVCGSFCQAVGSSWKLTHAYTTEIAPLCIWAPWAILEKLEGHVDYSQPRRQGSSLGKSGFAFSSLETCLPFIFPQDPEPGDTPRSKNQVPDTKVVGVTTKRNKAPFLSLVGCLCNGTN